MPICQLQLVPTAPKFSPASQRLEDGGILKRLDLNGVAYGDLVEAGGCLLVLSADDPSSEDGPTQVTCFDPSLGKALWSFHSKAAISTFHPLVYQGRAVIGWKGTRAERSAPLRTPRRPWLLEVAINLALSALAFGSSAVLVRPAVVCAMGWSQRHDRSAHPHLAGTSSIRRTVWPVDSVRHS
jgi:hypothetical protein